MRTLKTLRVARRLKTHLLVVVAAALALPFVAAAAVLVNDTFADGEQRQPEPPGQLHQDLQGPRRHRAQRRRRLRHVRHDRDRHLGEGFWGFFTNAGSPVNLGVGDKLVGLRHVLAHRLRRGRQTSASASSTASARATPPT